MSSPRQRHDGDRGDRSARTQPRRPGAARGWDTYEMVDVASPSIPARSRLYALPPCGVGTAQVESITSYTARLAQAHGLTIRQLIEGEIRPQFGLPDGPKGGRHFAASICKDDARALCGVRGWAAQWVTALESLTQRADLRFATLLPWANVLSHVDLIRGERAWCPDCYRTCQQTNQPVYDRLLWSIQEVTLCLRHRRPLQTRCPNDRCGKAQPYLMGYLRPGCCLYCSAWLGGATTSPPKPMSAEAIKWHIWVVEALGELLANAPKLLVLPQLERIVYATTLSAARITDHNLSALGRQIGRHDSVAWDLLAGKNPPTLGTLLRLCYMSGVRPLQFLTQTPLALKPRRAPSPLHPLFQRKRVQRAKHDDQALRQALEQAWQRPEPPFPSMREMGRRLGCDPHYLYRHFPERCKTIAHRYLASQTGEKDRRLEQLRARIRQAVFALHESRLFPSKTRVCRYLKLHRYWSDDEVWKAWRSAVDELGLAAADAPCRKHKLAASRI